MMRKHTTIDLDMRLVGEAAIVLETKRVNETVHAALREVVAWRGRTELHAPELHARLVPRLRLGRDAP